MQHTLVFLCGRTASHLPFRPALEIPGCFCFHLQRTLMEPDSLCKEGKEGLCCEVFTPSARRRRHVCNTLLFLLCTMNCAQNSTETFKLSPWVLLMQFPSAIPWAESAALLPPTPGQELGLLLDQSVAVRRGWLGLFLPMHWPKEVGK